MIEKSGKLFLNGELSDAAGIAARCKEGVPSDPKAQAIIAADKLTSYGRFEGDRFGASKWRSEVCNQWTWSRCSTQPRMVTRNPDRLTSSYAFFTTQRRLGRFLLIFAGTILGFALQAAACSGTQLREARRSRIISS